MEIVENFLGLYSEFLEITSPKNEGFTSVRCPFHDDHNKSAGVDLQTGVFKCLACGINHSAVKFVSRLLGVTTAQAGLKVDLYREEKGIPVADNKFSKKFVYAEERNDCREAYIKSKLIPLEETFAVEFCEGRGIDLEILKQADIGFLRAEDTPARWGRDSLVFPYFYGGKLVSLDYRARSGKKTCTEGALMVPWGIHELTDSDNFVISCEGASDRLSIMNELRKAGLKIKTISFPGATFRNEWERDLVGVNLFHIGDTDEAGDKLSEILQQKLPRTVIHRLQWLRGQPGKDFSDWIRQNKFETIVQDIVSTRKSTYNIPPLSTDEFLHFDEEDLLTQTYVEGFLTGGQIGVIAGPQKAKKTWFALSLVCGLLNGEGHEIFNIPQWKVTANQARVMFIEMEGASKKFKERVQLSIVQNVPPEKRANAVWRHKPKLQLDSEHDVSQLIQDLRRYNINVLIMDPYQRLHTKNEDSSTDTACVWHALSQMVSEIPNLVIILLHHFSKTGSVQDKWKSLRGSSRMGGEVDFGIFVESNGNTGAKLSCDFRDEEPITAPDGKEFFSMQFDVNKRLMVFDSSSGVPPKIEELIALVKENGGKLDKLKAIEHFGVSNVTINAWLKTTTALASSKPAPGLPSFIYIPNNG